jgi:N-acetyl-anhydromuramyl-L-alanine amidase AmpD
VESDGLVVQGDHTPEANLSTKTAYAAHTRRLNTGSIGVAMCGMFGAKESPFDPGKYPITRVQYEATARLCAVLCRRYGIPVTRETVLSHAEVEGTLGVKQRGKWDVTRLPWFDALKGAREVGDHFRALVQAELAAP